MSMDPRLVKKVVSKQLHRIKTISDLAQLLGSPAEALKKGFMRRERISLSKYLSEVRIERAKELLLKSDLKCKEICFAIGFSREDIGSRIFKRHTGISMKEFRKIGTRQQELGIKYSLSRELTDKNRLTIRDKY
jgi:AraC-like DNA-binding protein